jgi:hypothetical protein
MVAKERAMRSIDFQSSSTVVADPGGLTVLSAVQKTAAVTRVRYLEQRVFDEGGQVRKRLNRAVVEETVARINDLRLALGWLEIGLDGRWRWPDQPVPR